MASSICRPSITLFYDVASPYTWLAFEVCTRYSSIWNVDFSYKPFFLGGVMKAAGNKPPGTVMAKALYMNEDLKRCAKFFNVPLVPIKDQSLLYGTLPAQRLLTSASLYCPDYLVPLSRALWMRIWSKALDITQLASLKEACLSAGIDEKKSDDLLEKSAQQTVKDELKSITQVAIDNGAFGAPTFLIRLPNSTKLELFFGSDRFELMAHYLNQPWHGPDPRLSSSL